MMHPCFMLYSINNAMLKLADYTSKINNMDFHGISVILTFDIKQLIVAAWAYVVSILKAVICTSEGAT